MMADGATAGQAAWTYTTGLARYPDQCGHCLWLVHPGGVRPVGHVPVIDGAAVDFDPARIELEACGEPFSLAPDLAAAGDAGLRRLCRSNPGRRLFDGSVARLADCRQDGAAWRLTWQPAGYFDYLRSNVMLAGCAGPLSPPGASRFADAIGINLLLLTASGRLLVQRRAPDLVLWPGCWGTSAAGMAEPDDFAGIGRLDAFHPWREAEEELGLPPRLMAGVKVRFLGLTRELARGGSPELFFLGQLPLDADTVRGYWARARDRDETADLAEVDPADAMAVARLAESAGDALLAGLALLQHQCRGGRVG